jgi:hypothetical protein
VGKKYGCSKGYRQRNAAHMGSISINENIVTVIILQTRIYYTVKLGEK